MDKYRGYRVNQFTQSIEWILSSPISNISPLLLGWGPCLPVDKEAACQGQPLSTWPPEGRAGPGAEETFPHKHSAESGKVSSRTVESPPSSRPLDGRLMELGSQGQQEVALFWHFALHWREAWKSSDSTTRRYSCNITIKIFLAAKNTSIWFTTRK